MIKNVLLHNIGPFTETKVSFEHLDSPIMILGPNRVGKSTLFDAVAFALCGDFPSKVGSQYDRVRWGTDEGAVSVEFSVNSDRYKVEKRIDVKNRKTIGNVYVLRGSEWEHVVGPSINSVNKFMNELLGEPDTLLMTNFSSQFRKGDFLDYDPSERKKILSNMIGLRFNEVLPIFAGLKREVDSEYDKLQHTVEALSSNDDDISEMKLELVQIEKQTDALVESIRQIEQDSEELEKEREELSQEVEAFNRTLNRYNELRQILMSVDSVIKRYDLDLSNTTIDDFVVQQKKALDSLDITIREKRELLKAYQEYLTNKQRIEAEINKYESFIVSPDKIPCGGEGKFAGCMFLTKSVEAQDKLVLLKENLTNLNKPLENVSEIESAIEVASAKRDVVYMLVAALESNPAIAAADKYREELELLRDKVSQDIRDNLQLRKDDLNDARDTNTRQRSDLNARLVQYTTQKGQIIGMLESHAKNQKMLDVSRQRMKELAKDKPVLEALVTGFGVKGVQPLLLELALPEIFNTANDFLGEMSNGTLVVGFRTVKEVNKGKDQRETLIVEVTTPDGRVGDFKECSGAEQNMVRTAMRCALTIFNINCSNGLPIFFGDEMFGAYDSTNNQNAMRAFWKLARMIDQVFLISHQQETFGMAKNTITLRETPDGVVFDEE